MTSRNDVGERCCGRTSGKEVAERRRERHRRKDVAEGVAEGRRGRTSRKDAAKTPEEGRRGRVLRKGVGEGRRAGRRGIMLGKDVAERCCGRASGKDDDEEPSRDAAGALIGEEWRWEV